MKRYGIVALLISLTFVLIVSGVEAREPAGGRRDIERSWSQDQYQDLADPGLRGLYAEAASDTYCVVWYDFEMMNWQGWTRVDRTAQPDTFFHVDDFAGLGGGAFGRLEAIQGAKSMWCGARPDTADPYLCSWVRAPGYGNGWEQMLATDPIALAGGVTFGYRIVYDSEPPYDCTSVEYDAGGGDWRVLATYAGDGDATAEHFIPLRIARTKLRFRFSSDGAWSDQDGLWNSDGACIVDSIVVQDEAAYFDYQDFEASPTGALAAGIWKAVPEPGFGRYSKLANNLRDEDPCGDNVETQVVFFTCPWGEPWACFTPFCAGAGGIEAPCQNESVISPAIDMTRYSTNRNEVQDAAIPSGDLPELGGCYLRFTVYRDLPAANLVFYRWAVRKVPSGCPGGWKDLGFGYQGDERQYIYSTFDVSGFIAGDDPVQIELGIIDMCDVWYPTYGNCVNHTAAPYFDNVRLYRFKTSGPQWSYRDIDFFQDNFPGDESDIESFVRSDAAKDIGWSGNPAIRPGDSIAVDCDSPLGGGIGTDPVLGGPAVYLHVKCSYVGPAPAKPTLAGPALAGSVQTGDPPVTTEFNYVSDDGVWTKIQCENARTAGGEVPGKYMVDLNDEILTRGYMIEYYFTARDAASVESALPRYARSGPPYFEWTCLPTLRSDILFVDDFTGRGSFAGTVENYWMPAFEAVFPPPNCYVDKYDVNGPTSRVSNGPGSRAKPEHLGYYYTIVWDSGDLNYCTISDGTGYSDKSGDSRMLVDWMNLAEHHCGLWVCGDGIASDLAGSTHPSALELMSVWCGVDLASYSFFETSGGISGGGVVNPLVSGNPEGAFYHSGVPDRFYLWGGCPAIKNFDVLEKTGAGLYALDYPECQGTVCHAGIQASRTNANGHAVRTMWFGFSMQCMRDDANAAPIDRFLVVYNATRWLQSGASNVDITDAVVPAAWRLAQNFPNPFNPATTIRYDMRAKGLVTIKIYDVSGRLVRTLLDGVKEAGSYAAAWDGRNNLGAAAASGIYFCKMQTAGFSDVKKLVLLR